MPSAPSTKACDLRPGFDRYHRMQIQAALAVNRCAVGRSLRLRHRHRWHHSERQRADNSQTHHRILSLGKIIAPQPAPGRSWPTAHSKSSHRRYAAKCRAAREKGAAPIIVSSCPDPQVGERVCLWCGWSGGTGGSARTDRAARSVQTPERRITLPYLNGRIPSVCRC